MSFGFIPECPKKNGLNKVKAQDKRAINSFFNNIFINLYNPSNENIKKK